MSSLIDMFQSFKKSGRSATLTMSSKGGQATKVKLEVELDDAKPSPPSPPSTSTSSASAPSLPGCQAAGDRHRPRGSAARRAKANARAARHRAFQASPFPWRKCSVAQSTPAAPPRRPLRIHPSPTDKNCRQILAVVRRAGSQPTFSQLDGDGDLPPDCPRCQRQIDSIAPEKRIEGSKNCSPPHNPATCTNIKPCNNCDKCFHRICCEE